MTESAHGRRGSRRAVVPQIVVVPFMARERLVAGAGDPLAETWSAWRRCLELRCGPPRMGRLAARREPERLESGAWIGTTSATFSPWPAWDRSALRVRHSR